MSSKSKKFQKKRYLNRRQTQRINFKKSNKSKPLVFGKIFANGCGFCEAMKSDWKKLEKKMFPLKSFNIERSNQNMLIPKFNRKYKSNLAIQSGYPTIFKLKEKGRKPNYFNGGNRSEELLHLWLKDKVDDNGNPIPI